MKNKIQLEITTWTIVKVMLIVLIFYLLFLIKDIIALMFVVLILVVTFSPVVKKWSKYIGRIPSVIALVLIIIGIMSLAIYLILPPVLDQIQQLGTMLPIYFDRYSYLREYIPSIEQSLSTLTKGAATFTQSIASITAGIFGGIIALITAIVLFVYLLFDEHLLRNFVISLFPLEHREKMIAVFRKLASKVGDWFRGQLVLGAIIGVIDLIGLLIIGVPYALTLAMISGILEFIPTIGPILAGILATVVALTDSPIKALIIIIFYIAVQQLENAFLVPKVMQKAVGLSPVIIILAILIGARLMGIVGAVLAVPIAALISVLIEEWPTVKKLLRKE